MKKKTKKKNKNLLNYFCDSYIRTRVHTLVTQIVAKICIPIQRDQINKEHGIRIPNLYVCINLYSSEIVAKNLFLHTCTTTTFCIMKFLGFFLHYKLSKIGKMIFTNFQLMPFTIRNEENKFICRQIDRQTD